MRIVLVCLLAVSLLSVSCLKKDNGCSYKDDNLVAPDSEQQVLKAYLDSAHITASWHKSGFGYQVINSGSGAVPGLCSQIEVTYIGQLTTGKVFDQQVSSVFGSLGSLIDGWKKGLPLIEKSGEIKLYIPPSLGYGTKNVTDNYGNVVIPANSILIFDISLINVQ
jgi:FKBP-type peptidyl-prolyl cis-trans isomerase FkpA